MSNSNLSNPYTDTCAYCLGDFHLNGEKDIPIRHGFNAYHIRHGQTGGYHTGPCRGVNYPRLGVSTQGTQVALAEFKAQLNTVMERLAWLATNPELTWSYQETERTSRTGTNRRPVGDKIERILKPGVESERIEYKTRHGYTSHLVVPSYAQEHASQKRQWEYHQQTLNELITKFQGVIDAWQPHDKVYNPVKPVVHLQQNYKAMFGGVETVWDGPSCRHVRYQDRFKFKMGTNLTTDRKLVTCQRCKGH